MELSLAKKQQMEAIKLLNDWSKWVITIETAAIAGIFAVLKELSSARGSGLWLQICAVALNLLLLAAVAAFILSIYNAAQLLYSLPGITEQLPKSTKESINEMKDDYMGKDIFTYEKRQFIWFVTGLVLVAAVSAVVIVQNLVLLKTGAA
jgi:hypothetical protein